MPVISLDTSDATALVELLQLLRDWIDTDKDQLDTSLTNHVAAHDYNPTCNIDQLRVGLDRFTFLISDRNGEPPF